MVKKKLKKILIFGGSGLVGSRCVELFSSAYCITAPTHVQVDVTNEILVSKVIEDILPDVIIYAAAIARIDFAEKHEELAKKINADAPTYISKRASMIGVPVIYLSTNEVFGKKSSDIPYSEEDIPFPASIYAKTKYKGEEGVYAASSNNLILRLIMPYSAQYKNRLDFARKAVKYMSEGKKYPSFTDQTANPIYVDDVVASLDVVIKNQASGFLHIGATDCLSNFAFMEKLAKKFNLDTSLLLPMKLSDFYSFTKAKRGNYSCLDTRKFIFKYGNSILHSVDENLESFKKNYSGIDV